MASRNVSKRDLSKTLKTISSTNSNFTQLNKKVVDINKERAYAINEKNRKTSLERESRLAQNIDIAENAVDPNNI